MTYTDETWSKHRGDNTTSSKQSEAKIVYIGNTSFIELSVHFVSHFGKHYQSSQIIIFLKFKIIFPFEYDVPLIFLVTIRERYVLPDIVFLKLELLGKSGMSHSRSPSYFPPVV